MDSENKDKAAIAILRAALAAIVGADSESELIKIKAHLLMLNEINPNPDIVVAIAGVDALLATTSKP